MINKWQHITRGAMRRIAGSVGYKRPAARFNFCVT